MIVSTHRKLAQQNQKTYDQIISNQWFVLWANNGKHIWTNPFERADLNQWKGLHLAFLHTHTPKIFPLVRSASVQVNQQGSSACSGSWMAVDSVWHEVTPKELITIPLLHVISFPIWTSFKFLWSRNPIRNYQNIEWHSSWKIQNILFFELYLWSGWICDCVFVE